MRRLDVSLAFALLAGLAVLAMMVLREDRAQGHGRAVDGDTIELSGTHIRLKGMDAPELHQTCMRDARPWACGKAARARLARALRAGPVTCAFFKRDKYGRPLARCAVAGQDLGALMVRDGLAVTYLDSTYGVEEAAARAERRGIWAGSFQAPSAYRAAHPR